MTGIATVPTLAEARGFGGGHFGGGYGHVGTCRGGSLYGERGYGAGLELRVGLGALALAGAAPCD